MSDCGPHAYEGPAGVKGKEDVVRDDQNVEGQGFAERPRPIIPLFVDLVDISDTRRVHKGYGDGPANMQHSVVDIGADRKGMREGMICDWRTQGGCIVEKAGEEVLWGVSWVNRMSGPCCGWNEEHAEDFNTVSFVCR